MRRAISFIIMALLILSFLVSASFILKGRFEKGDVYPRYSSLRHDPMGTSILFDSFKKTGCTVEILTEEKFPEIMNPQDTILFILSPKFAHFPDNEADRIAGFILSGGRVFMTADNENGLMDFFDTGIDMPECERKHAEGNEEIKKDPEREKAGKKKGEIEERIEEKGEDGDEKEPCLQDAIQVAGFDFSPDSIPVFGEKSLITRWPRAVTVLSSGHDVMLLLSHGKGDIIISTESYFISNESLAKMPPVTFLSWIMGGRTHVLVDEYHHGVLSKKGVSFLLRKYHLYWFIAYLALISLISLWHILPTFRKPLPRESTPGANIRSSLDGYTHLLTRTIPRKGMLDISMDQWLKGSANRFFREKNWEAVKGIRENFPSGDIRGDGDLIKAYNEITQRLKEQIRFL